MSGREAFEAWANERDLTIDSRWEDWILADEAWQSAWQHQQKRIESLQAKLNVAVKALEYINTNVDFFPHLAANEALAEINRKGE
jgi:hypothetical protein